MTLARSYTVLEERRLRVDDIGEIVGISHERVSVSYTHLDVYKRQSIYCEKENQPCLLDKLKLRWTAKIQGHPPASPGQVLLQGQDASSSQTGLRREGQCYGEMKDNYVSL